MLQVAEHAAQFLVEVVVLCWEVGVQLLADGFYLAGFRFSAATHDDTVGPQEGELAHFVELVEVDFQETLHAGYQTTFQVTTGETEQGMNGC